MVGFTPDVNANGRPEEWQELQAVLQSGILGKSPNMQRFLDYIAERYFSGGADDVKEYSIAVEALHRPSSFNPQSDTIVRVTAHALRKRLKEFYDHEGSGHRLQLQVPPGRYALKFVNKQEPVAVVAIPADNLPRSSSDLQKNRRRLLQAIGVGVATAVLVLSSVFAVQRYRRMPGLESHRKLAESRASSDLRGAGLVSVTGSPQRVLVGESSKTYFDASGRPWSSGHYCSGGVSFVHADHTILGADDQAIYQQGRIGRVNCAIPVKPGPYQLRILFANTLGDGENARKTMFSINNGPAQTIDVVDQAGHNDTATANVFAGIHPLKDGSIHVNTLNDETSLNAIEVLPAPSDDPLPLRMVVGPTAVRDDEGHFWEPDMFFSGGKRVPHPSTLPRVANSRIYAWERYGHFQYFLPVAQGEDYRVTLFLSEGWFGAINQGPGGINSRIFDVSCNGEALLKHYDILQSAASGTVTPTFHHIKPTAQGLLELSFTPVVNYPKLNAIEIVPER